MIKQPGVIYIVATPIGNREDISARALRVLNAVDLIAAEDTRHSGSLLQHFSITTPLVALHDHNEREYSQQLIEKVVDGINLAVITDAGTPLISDPGFYLVQQARKQSIELIPIPGACAAITALSVAGLPTDRFIFEGFLPAKEHARCQKLLGLKNEERTLIFYESPHRLLASIKDMESILGGTRPIVLAKELTKRFETVHACLLNELCSWLTADPQRQKGEFVLILAGVVQDNNKLDITVQQTLEILLTELPIKQAVTLASKICGEKKNLVYRMALELREKTAK